LEFVFTVMEILGLLGAIITIAFYFYKKKPRLKICGEIRGQEISLVLENKSDFAIGIEYIRLIKKKGILKGFIYDEDSFFHLVESEEHGFSSSQNDKLDLKILPEDPVMKIDIPLRNIESLYHDFLPYELTDTHYIGRLSLPIKMPDCYIGIYLKNGKLLTVRVHEPFYSYYRRSMGSSYDEDIAILMGHRRVKVHFNSIESYMTHKNKLLDCYATSKRNEHNLKK